MAFVYTGKKVDLGSGRGWLDTAPAASVKRIDRALGHPLQITEAGRTWGQQNVHWVHYQRYGSPIALNPNTPSIHQKGWAMDSDEAQRFVAFMAEHGWIRTVYRWVNGKWTLVEGWHFEYFIDRDKHRFDPTPTPGGKDVIKNTQDAKAKTKDGRLVAPGAAFWLNTLATAPAKNAVSVTGKAGEYAFALHVYAEGTPGDVVEVTLQWDRPNQAAHSVHYVERLVIEDGGVLRRNFPFIRGVATGEKVYAHMVADKGNTKPVKITRFDVDALTR